MAKEQKSDLARQVEEFVRVASERFERRRCFACGADSGTELLLPAGWSYLVFGEAGPAEHRGQVAAFFCPSCATRMNLAEERNYHAGRN
jgi:hypothetical protein